MTLLMTPRPLRSRTFRLDQVRRRRDPGTRTARVVAVAGDDAGDVRAVTVVVVRRRAVVDEVDERGHALPVLRLHNRRRAVVREVVVPGGDTRVDDRHADARARVAQALLDGARADGDRDAIHLAAGGAVPDDAGDRGMVGELPERPFGSSATCPLMSPRRRPSLPPSLVTSDDASSRASAE